MFYDMGIGGNGGGRGGGSGMRGLKLGVVTSLNDKSNLNKVKALIPDLKLETPYLPVIQSMASKKKGSVIIPDVGDVVVIGFIGGKISNGIILGSIYHSQNKPITKVNKKNSIMRMRTKGGIDIAIDNTKDKQKVSVKTPKGLSMVLDDKKQSITLSDKTTKNFIKLEPKKQNLAIQTGKKIFLKAGSTSLTLENGKGLSFKSSLGGVNMKCKDFKVTANAAAKIEGMAKAELKSKGAAILKGTINKIG